MRIYASVYTRLTVSGILDFDDTSTFWTKDATRIANIPDVDIAMVTASSSSIVFNGYQKLLRTSSGYPAAATTQTTAFNLTGSDKRSITLTGSYADIDSYSMTNDKEMFSYDPISTFIRGKETDFTTTFTSKQESSTSKITTNTDLVSNGTYTNDTLYQTIGGSGVKIVIPFTAQSSRWERHKIKIAGMQATNNTTPAKGFSVEFAVASFSTLSAIETIYSSPLITSVLVVGLTVEITLSTSLSGLAGEFNLLSRNSGLVDIEGIYLTS
jgi:hypothetical protein